MTEVYPNKNNCYGCIACKNICPSNAIKMLADGEGFLYPKIDPALCCNCGKCKDVCPLYEIEMCQEEYKQRIYAVKHKEEAIRLSSTSGGMFTALSDAILESNGVVYGAILDENLKVCHHRAITKEKRDEMKGSKYVQSDIGEIYKAVKSDLLNEKQVLFTGTPCQIAGLRNYLNHTDIINLILCDIICHGVPSNTLWTEYVKFVEKEKKASLKMHFFRTKINGWHATTTRNLYYNGKEDSRSILSQIHMSLFLNNLILRPCCYTCKFSSFSRNSDITLGDFWGIEKSMPEFDDNKGISLVLINTLKGSTIFDNIQDKLEVRESNSTNCLQHNLIKATIYPSQREQFWKEYAEYGYEYVTKKYARYTLPCIIKQSFLDVLKNIKILRRIKKHLFKKEG